MTTFTDINAAIEEAVWLSHVYQTAYCVYQRTADVMEVSPQDPSRNPMYTAGVPGVVTTDYRSAA
ncbi:hypothetical protein [Mixta mediterraneensis]|uniref:hypothetical protein n=1 Tax=Mixta mediterraneensis TaxID=2758443 RepID=UPI001873844B|nr:hypothetical protein [Mixta mediterraneensis]MBE5254539.1 hypothetical protein [Mixta mediterraneensis]